MCELFAGQRQYILFSYVNTGSKNWCSPRDWTRNLCSSGPWSKELTLRRFKLHVLFNLPVLRQLNPLGALKVSSGRGVPRCLRTADVFPEGEKRRPEIRLQFAGYVPPNHKVKIMELDFLENICGSTNRNRSFQDFKQWNCITLFKTQEPENHALFRSTYLSWPNKGVPLPHPRSGVNLDWTTGKVDTGWQRGGGWGYLSRITPIFFYFFFIYFFLLNLASRKNEIKN